VRLFDSEAQQKCTFCETPIEAQEPKIVYGTGNSLQYLRIYHLDCDSIRKAGREAEYREFCRQNDRTRREII
jgi:nitrate reductase beta subunit